MNASCAINHSLRPLPLPIWVIDAAVRSAKRILCNNICRQGGIRFQRIYRLTGVPASLESRTELLDKFTYQWLHTSNGLLGEERVHRAAAKSMQIVIFGTEGGR